MGADNWKNLYTNKAGLYDAVVAFEDFKANLIAELDFIHPLEGARVIDFGAGTARITRQILPKVHWVWAFDLTPAMIAVAHQKLIKTELPRWATAVGDSRAMPLQSQVADLSVEGWSFVQIKAWHESDWQRQVGRAVREMVRVTRPGGTVVLVETLGTGVKNPAPPPQYQDVYTYFEEFWGFEKTWIRTDFRVPPGETGKNLLAGMFGEKILDKIETLPDGSGLLPECTGIWYLYL